MKTKARWLEHHLFRNPGYLAFCVNEKEFHKVLRSCKLPPHRWVAFNKATAHVTSFYKDDSLICVLCLDVASEAYKKASIEQIVALLAHEVTHIKQRIMEDIGEDSPSREFEAYMVQELMQTVMKAYRDLSKGKGA